ncbi:hypothetical protein FO519_002928 [Halicephalobus sp. NKZ332]|nr:hypothetical protein FO519_002928 [Halicephalobus sp. NKZ332]
MRAPDEVNVHHLVVDTGGFIKNAPLIDIGSKIYTLDAVVKEIRDKETRQRLKALPFELIIKEPSNESIKAVIDVSKKTGDYASLSFVDLKVIALALDLHIEHCGRESVVFDVQPKPPIWEDVREMRKKALEEKIAANQEKKEVAEGEMSEALKRLDIGEESALEGTDGKTDSNELTDGHENSDTLDNGSAEDDDKQEDHVNDEENTNDQEDSPNDEEQEVGDNESEEEPDQTGKKRSGFGEWIDESNIQEVVARMEAPVNTAERKMKVACLTTDFALQNVLLHMKLNICSIDGIKVNRLRSFILRCRICKKTTPVVTKTFCPDCGHQSLHKVGISVDKYGVQRIHINWERERVKRGYRFNMPMPKGGKHGNDILYMEDQQIPMNSMARIREDFLCNYCHEGFIERVPGPVPNRQPMPNAGPRIHMHRAPLPQLYPHLNVLSGIHIHPPNQGQNIPGGSQGPRAVRITFRTDVPPGFVFPQRPPAPPNPGMQPQPQPNGAMGGLGAMLANFWRPVIHAQRNPGTDGTNGQSGQQGSQQPTENQQQQPGGNVPNLNQIFNILSQVVPNLAQQQQGSQQRDEQNVNQGQERPEGEQTGGNNQQATGGNNQQATGGNNQQATGGNTPVNFGQMLNSLFQSINPMRNQQGAQQQDGQNPNQNQEGQPSGENQQPAGGNIRQNLSPVFQMLQSLVYAAEQQAQQGNRNEEGGENVGENQEQQQPGMAPNFLEEFAQIFGGVGGAPGDGPNQEGERNERQGELNWMQLLRALLPQGVEVQINGVNIPPNDPNFENILNRLFNNAMGQSAQGISEENLRRLPMTKVSETHVENETQCVTCMETFKLDEDVVELGCKHIFHKSCLIPWLQTHVTCPVCRAQVDPTNWPSAPPEENQPGSNGGFADMDELD